MPRPVLIVEDDPDIAEGLRYNLEREGLTVRVADTGEKGLEAALDQRHPPLLVLLDLMLPGMSGTDLCRRLRREPATRRTPIIMLTARTGETDRVAGLDLGADDYITKPFSVRELMARVRAVLRRAEESASPRYEDGCLSVDFENMRVWCNGDVLNLTRKEFALLSALAKSAGRIATRQRLLDEVWGYDYYGDTASQSRRSSASAIASSAAPARARWREPANRSESCGAPSSDLRTPPLLCRRGGPFDRAILGPARRPGRALHPPGGRASRQPHLEKTERYGRAPGRRGRALKRAARRGD